MAGIWGLVERARTIASNYFFEKNFNTISLIPRTETYILELNATAVIKINIQGYVAVWLGE
jgi:hypothetical protein